MTARGASPRWRTWGPLLALAAIALFAVAFGITELPLAPVAPTSSPIPDTTAGRLVRQIEMVNYPTSQVGWAVVPSRPYWRLVHTIDGGRRWLDVTPPGSASNGGIAVTVMGSSTAAVVFLAFQYIRNSTFAITSDGGGDWTAGVLPNAVSAGPDPIFALNSRHVWAVLGNGTVLASSNGGQRWAPVALPTMTSGSCSPTSVWFTSPSSGWVTGKCAGVAALWHSADAGSSWQAVVLPGSYASSAKVSVAPPQATASGGALTTAATSGHGTASLRVFDNSSGSWVSPPAVALPAGRVLVSFEDASHGWVLDAPRAKGALALAYYTSNGGINWSLRTTPIAAGEVTGLDLVSPESVVALAQAGREKDLWSSADAGIHWKTAKMAIFNGPVPRVNGIVG